MSWSWLMPLLWSAAENPVARQMRAQLKAGQWEQVEAQLRDIPDWNDRFFYLDRLSDWLRRLSYDRFYVVWPSAAPVFLNRWVEAQPQSSLAWTVRGWQAMKWGWAARGGGTADTVSKYARATMVQALEQAYEDFSRAAELDEEDPTPHALLIDAGRGLGLDGDDLGRHFDEAVQRCPHHRGAHHFYFTTLCEKWGGSHKAMFDFCRAVSQQEPGGGGLHTLIARAHIERWVWLALFAERPSGAGYFRRDPIRQEIQDAYKRSLGSEQCRETLTTSMDANFFAFCLLRAGDRGQALHEFRRIGNRVTENPWCYEDEGYCSAFYFARLSAWLGLTWRN